VSVLDRRSPTGEQFELVFGRHAITVTEVGATLRTYTVEGEDVLDGFAADERAMSGRGQVLAPWPNRLGHGRYSFEGREGQAALNEPELGNAIHGLVRWVPWQVVSNSVFGVTLACTVYPQPAYPWLLELQVEYRLGPDGPTVTTRASNLSDAPAPFGVGFHPYLTVGVPRVDDVTLTIPAGVRLSSDERGLPVGRAPVAGTDLDFTSPRTIGATTLDTAYTELTRAADGRARIELAAPRGRRVSLWVGEGFDYVMVFTGDTVEPASRRRCGIAIEPMTCPPNALASGQDVIRLDAGSTWQGAWGIEA